MNLKDKKKQETVDNLRECDKMLKLLRNSDLPNKDEQIAFYEHKKAKQEQILQNLKRY